MYFFCIVSIDKLLTVNNKSDIFTSGTKQLWTVLFYLFSPWFTCTGKILTLYRKNQTIKTLVVQYQTNFILD